MGGSTGSHLLCMLQGELLLVLKDGFELLLQLQVRSQLFLPELGKIDDAT